MAKYLIVGGVAGGASVAARLRRLDEHAGIIMFEKGNSISYANCGFPYYIGGKITDRNQLFLQTPQSFKARLNVEVRTETVAIKIFRERKALLVQDLTTDRIYEETYDKLVLSPGAEPLRPPISGIDDEAIFTLRSVSDTDKIIDFINTHQVRKAIIIGAGFIGLEMTENLYRLGIFVTIAEMAEQVMSFLDYEMAVEVHQHLKCKQVEFYLNDAVSAFSRNTEGLIVKLQSGKELKAELAILSIGVRPDSSLAAEAGLEIGVNGGIVVNKYLQTSDPDIYAVGDAICFPSPLTGKQTTSFLAGPANKQGRICADNLVNGNTSEYEGTIGTAIAKVFDLTVAATGLSEKVLKAEGIPYLTSISHGISHAGYYPDALPLSIKINYSPERGKLYGAQIIGYEGADKRADLLAAVIKNGGTIYDLIKLEHAYAPPYSSAKDPVNIAGLIAENILRGYLKIIGWNEISSLDPDNSFLLDVRTPEEFMLGTVNGSVNIPLDEIRSRLDEIPHHKKIVIICTIGQRGYLAARILLQRGFSEVYNLSGGYKTYALATQKQGNEDIFEDSFIGKDNLIYQCDPDAYKS